MDGAGGFGGPFARGEVAEFLGLELQIKKAAQLQLELLLGLIAHQSSTLAGNPQRQVEGRLDAQPGAGVAVHGHELAVLHLHLHVRHGAWEHLDRHSARQRVLARLERHVDGGATISERGQSGRSTDFPDGGLEAQRRRLGRGS